MTDDHTSEGAGADLSTTLRSALQSRPEPAPSWDMDAIRARGRARRFRTRLLPVATGLAVVVGLTAGVAGADGPWPWRTSTTTTVAAPTVSGHPADVVRRWMQARLDGDVTGAYDRYWIPGIAAVIDTGGSALPAEDVTVGAATARPPVWTSAGRWPQAVQVPLSYRYDDGPGLTTGKAPFSGTVTLVRESDGDAWRIVSADDALRTALSDTPVLTATAQDGETRQASAAYGVVALEGGCLRMGSAFLVWPSGAVWDAATTQVVLPDGTRIDPGDRVLAGGQPLTDLTASLGVQQATFAAACGGLDVPVGTEPPAGGRPVLEVSGPWD